MSEEQKPFDPETASWEELVAKANEEAAQSSQTENKSSQEENKEPVREQIEEQQETQQVDDVVYRREIDLGDGSGVQVFEAPSMEELVDKLATAQVNATKKIRELSAAKKTPTQNEPNAEEEWVLAQELATNPSLAFDKLFQKKLGRTPAEVQKGLERLAEIDRQNAELEAANAFVAAHPDYVPTPKNGARIEKWLKVEGMEGTPENIEKAYQDLSESGLLETKRPETQATETQNGTRIVTVSSHQRRAASGLSSKRTVSTASRATEPTEEEAYNMPWEKLVALANAEATGKTN